MMDEKLRIFLCEDDENLGMILREYLQAKGFTTDLFTDGEAGLKGFSEAKYDICLLDVMMPKKDGFTLAQDIRQINPDVPLVFLTAKTMNEDVLEGFKNGADDYLTKPFDLDELTARVTALLRRTRPAEEAPALRRGALTLDVPAHRVLVGDQELALTPAEFTVLEALMSAERRVVSTVALVRLLEGTGAAPSSLKTHMSRLRAKIRALDPETDYIETVWGLGYRMSAA